MLKPSIISKRAFLTAAGGLGTMLLAGCDQITESETARGVFDSAEPLNRAIQGALGPQALAAEFPEPIFRPLSGPTAQRNRTPNSTTKSQRTALPIGASMSVVSWNGPRNSRSPTSARCRRGRRSPGTIALKVGAALANGKAHVLVRCFQWPA